MKPLSPPVAAAVRAVIAWARDSTRAFNATALGSMLLYQYVGPRPGAVLEEVRAALGLRPEQRGALAAWAQGRERLQLADELERLLPTSEASAST